MRAIPPWRTEAPSHAGGTTGSLAFSNIAEDISFSGNTAGENGGAINNDFETVEWSGVGNVSFTSNNAETGAGGAIWTGMDMTVDTAASFTVTDNRAGDGGGGIYAAGSISFSGVDNIIFSGNHASTYGGAISAYNDITVSDSGKVTFSGNTRPAMTGEPWMPTTSPLPETTDTVPV